MVDLNLAKSVHYVLEFAKSVEEDVSNGGVVEIRLHIEIRFVLSV
jgi:hypothetical protein